MTPDPNESERILVQADYDRIEQKVVEMQQGLDPGHPDGSWTVSGGSNGWPKSETEADREAQRKLEALEFFADVGRAYPPLEELSDRLIRVSGRNLGKTDSMRRRGIPVAAAQLPKMSIGFTSSFNAPAPGGVHRGKHANKKKAEKLARRKNRGKR